MNSFKDLNSTGREILAQDGESLIEKYSKGISSVNEILRTDRISQQIVLKELLTKQRKIFNTRGSLGMRKTISVPNMKYFRTSISSDNLHSPAQMPAIKMSDSFHEGTPLSGFITNSKVKLC